MCETFVSGSLRTICSRGSGQRAIQWKLTILDKGCPLSADTTAVTTQEERFDEIYAAHAPLMFHLAQGKFHLPHHEAEDLVQEVFISYLSARDGVRDTRAWLVGAICYACRRYCQKRAATLSKVDAVGEYSRIPDPNSVEFWSRFAETLTIRQTLGRLQEKCRRTLRLHYFEGCTAREVAIHLATTDRYAEKLIHDCLRRAYTIYKRLTRI